MRRAILFVAILLSAAALLPWRFASGASTPTPDLQATISALETQVAEAESTSAGVTDAQEPTTRPTMTPTVMPSPTRNVLLGPDQEHDESSRPPRRTPTSISRPG